MIATGSGSTRDASGVTMFGAYEYSLNSNSIDWMEKVYWC